MKKIRFIILAALVLMTSLTSTMSLKAATTQKSVLYVMHYLSPESSTTQTLNDIKNSGFDTVIVFSIDGTATGDFTFFGTPIFTNGNYVGPAGWPEKIRSLKEGTTSVTRLAFCLAGPYTTYRNYMNTYGTGPGTNWYKNFAKLKELTGADAIDLNDENCYDTASTVMLGQMLNTIGYKVSLCPYNNSTHWRNVKTQLGDIVDAVNLQCYDGGAYNNVGTWNTYFGGLKVTPLFWTLHADGTGDTYITAETKVRNWTTSYGITSAGAWQYSDMRDFSGGTAAQFNTAIRNGLNVTVPTQTKVSLTSYFNADGFSYDTARNNGNFDGSGYTYSADLVIPNPTFESVSYQFGSFANGSNNVIRCTGQTITLPQGQYTSVRLLASAYNGNKTGTFRIHYTDGTYTNVSVAMRDWCGSTSGQKVVQAMNHRHSQTADQATTNRIFAYYLAPTAGKTVASIQCPNVAGMNVFAITVVN